MHTATNPRFRLSSEVSWNTTGRMGGLSLGCGIALVMGVPYFREQISLAYAIAVGGVSSSVESPSALRGCVLAVSLLSLLAVVLTVSLAQQHSTSIALAVRSRLPEQRPLWSGAPWFATPRIAAWLAFWLVLIPCVAAWIPWGGIVGEHLLFAAAVVELILAARHRGDALRFMDAPTSTPTRFVGTVKPAPAAREFAFERAEAGRVVFAAWRMSEFRHGRRRHRVLLAGGRSSRTLPVSTAEGVATLDLTEALAELRGWQTRGVDDGALARLRRVAPSDVASQPPETFAPDLDLAWIKADDTLWVCAGVEARPNAGSHEDDRHAATTRTLRGSEHAGPMLLAFDGGDSVRAQFRREGARLRVLAALALSIATASALLILRIVGAMG